jgi:hypothetical protein
MQGNSFEDFVQETMEKGLDPMYKSKGDVILKYGTVAFRGAPAQTSAAN